jgi:predicted HAD superfamily Cof-like phosphohydrolase
MEKQTMNAIKSIYKFNKDAGLLDEGYNPFLECSMSIEESLEQLNTLEALAKVIYNDEMSIETSPKKIAREIVGLAYGETFSGATVDDVDLLDKHIDAIFINFGSVFKLGLSPQQAIKALSIVCDANLTKLSAGQDEHGKQRKPADFVPPEQRLQLILDEREPKC